MVGPIAGAKVAESANSASPTGCFGFGSKVMMMVNAIGISTPPVKPWIARSTIIWPRFCGEGAGDREDQEQHRVGQQVAAQREHLREPAGERDDDDLGDQVGGGDPAAVIDAGADRALDVGERGVDDLDVQHRHEGAEGRADHGDPASGAPDCPLVLAMA